MPPTLPTPRIHNLYHILFYTSVPQTLISIHNSLKISLDAVSDSVKSVVGSESPHF